MKFQVNHDLHLHSQLSLCSGDPTMTPQAILDFGLAHGYEAMCLTDHYWDELCAPAPNGFYEPQDTPHVLQGAPLPQDARMRYTFGCETDFWGGRRFGVSAQHADLFSFIVIPPNHFHMTCDHAAYETPEKRADLFLERLEEIQQLDLPWKKVGIAHMTCSLMWERDVYEVVRVVDTDRFAAIMRFFAERGTGIEFNAGAFNDTVWAEKREDCLRLYRIARDAGCKFYCASDAHHPKELSTVLQYLPRVAEALELTEEQRYRIPE